MKIIVHDLQTREENCFHFNKIIEMFSKIKNEKEVATHDEQRNCSFNRIISHVSLNIKQKHTLISVFANNNSFSLSSFSRTDRLTCFFTLLLMAYLMQIMYYDLKETSTNNKNEFEFTPQIVILILIFTYI